MPTFERQLIGLAVVACFAAAVHANPAGPAVAHGTASFATSGNTLTVTNTPGAIINWQAFSIRPDEVTRFIQSGAASAVLNRVTGAGQSAILGQLLSNGRVFLINPNGVVVGAGARIDTAGFVASSLNLSNEDFLAGRFRFTDPGNAGKVTNAGAIDAHSGGPVYLIAPTVENHGVITAPNGDILLAAGKSVELVSAADPHLRVQLQAGGEAVNVGQLLAESGRVGLYGAAIRNAGTISADSASVNAAGNVVLKASRDVTLESTSVVSASGAKGGTVEIQAEQGTLLAEGRVDATGATDKGGEIRLLGAQVGLIGNAVVDASGAKGGGMVLVGGDYQGKNPEIQNAARVVLAPDAKVVADATERGDGGRVIVWSDEYTGFYGAISARGGAAGGNGGFVETSSRDNLQAFGAVDAAAPAGRAGEWLLDPRNVTILNAASSNGAFGGGAPNVFTPTGDSAVADRNTIQTSLNAGTSVTITTGATGTQAGDIVVQDSITKTTTTGAPTLALNAAGGIAVNNAISGSAANRVLNVNMNAGAGVTFGGAGSITSRNGAVTMTAGGAVALGTVNAGSGALSVTAGGPITQNAGTALTTTGATTLAAGAANDITLASATNSFGNVRVASGNNVSIRDNSAFAFGGGVSTVSGNLTIDANGGVTQAAGATLAVGGTTTINTRAANSDVTLNLANNFGGAVSVLPAANNTRNVSLQDTGALTLGAITATGNLAVQAAGSITDAGNLAITGTTTLTAGAANDITLDNANNFGGQVRIVSGRNVTLNDINALAFGAGGNSTVSGDLSVAAAGAVTQANGLIVTGATSINAAAANNITLTNAANNFSGPVSATGNTVSLLDANAIVLGTVNAAGALAVTSNGATTDTGILTVAGTTTLTAGAANDITLDNANDFGGQVRIASARDATLNDVNALAFGAGGTSTVSRNLIVTAAGPITQANPLAVTGATTLAAGAANNITLTNAANTFGNVRIASGNNVSIRDNTALAFGGGASTVSGLLTVDSNGSVTQAAGSTLAVSGGMSVNTRGANADVTLNLANDVAGAVAIAPATGTIRDVSYRSVNAAAQTPTTPASLRNLTLTLDNAPVALAAATLSGNLNVTAGGAITDNGNLAIAGTTTLAAGATNGITLDNANNFAGNVRIVSGNNVTLNDVNALAFGGGASAVSGNLVLTTAGAITQASALAVNGTTSINAGVANDVTLANNANDFVGAVSVAANDISLRDANGLPLGTVTATTSGGDTGSLTLQAAGSVTQTGVVTTPALAATLTGGASALNLGTRPNAIAALGAVAAPGGVTLTNGNVALAVNGNVTATNAPVSISTGTAGYTQGNVDVNAGSGPITITADTVAIAANTGNNAFATSGTLTLKPASAGQAMSLAGAAAFDLTQAELTAFSTGATGPIVIGDAAAATGTMTIGGTANLAGKTLTLNAGAITDGANPGRTITATNLNLNARTGAIGSAAANGAIDVAATNLTVNTVNQNAYVSAAGAVNLGAGTSNLGAGGLNLTATGPITQSGAITATGSSVLAAGAANNITLANAANDFGTVVVTGGNNVALNDANALALGASTVGTLTATASGALAVNGVLTTTAAGNSIVLSGTSFANNLGAGALIVPIGGRWVVYSTHPAGDTFNGLASGNQAIWNTTFAGNPPGTIPAGNRYVFSMSGTPATLTFTSTNAAKVYGDVANVSGNYTVSGFVNAATYGNVFTQDTAANTFTGAPSVTSAGAPAAANVGLYPIAIAPGTVATTIGYALAFNAAGQLTVTARPITIRADDQARAYGDPNPTTGPYTITAGSLAGADSITNVNVTSAALVTSPVGPYALTPTAANFGTGAATNYAIAFADGVLTVTPRPITVTANNQTKVYGQPDPALTFTAPTVNGDVLAGTPARAAGEAVAGGPYAITQGTVTSANNSNYTITFVNGQLVITPAALTVAADNKARLYGDANPPLTATFTGLTNGDTPAAVPGVALTTPATLASSAGSYAINVASGANSNYLITYVNGQLVVTPAPLTITANDAARPVNQPNPPFTATYAGFKNGETPASLGGALAFATPAAVASPPGAYSITPSGQTATNYTITYVDGVLTVVPVPVVPVPPVVSGVATADNALITATQRSAEAGDDVAPRRPDGASVDCLALERAGQRRVLGRCF